MSEAARIAALKAATEFRTGAMTPEQCLDVARHFEQYLVGDKQEYAPRRGRPPKDRTSLTAPVARP